MTFRPGTLAPRVPLIHQVICSSRITRQAVPSKVTDVEGVLCSPSVHSSLHHGLFQSDSSVQVSKATYLDRLPYIRITDNYSIQYRPLLSTVTCSWSCDGGLLPAVSMSSLFTAQLHPGRALGFLGMPLCSDNFMESSALLTFVVLWQFLAHPFTTS